MVPNESVHYGFFAQKKTLHKNVDSKQAALSCTVEELLIVLIASTENEMSCGNFPNVAREENCNGWFSTSHRNIPV